MFVIGKLALDGPYLKNTTETAYKDMLSGHWSATCCLCHHTLGVELWQGAAATLGSRFCVHKIVINKYRLIIINS